jgi:aminoglycoside phosphotransferase (APT) family kinase protein
MSIDRQSLFSGTEQPAAHLKLDAAALEAYLHEPLLGFKGPLEIVKFKGGQSNPTYRISGGDRRIVLRRRPPGRLLESAHAIDREYRILSALHAIGFPVPRPHLYCADASVIGSEFYVVDYCEGRVFWNADMPGADRRTRETVYDEMSRLLARLHSLDVAALGLADFGKRGGYAARNLARWSKQYIESKLIDIPDMDWLMAALRERLPPEQRSVLLHGDFGLYNIIVHPEEPRILAVLDWEMATLGDPLIDLAHHIRAWWDPPDPINGSATSLVGLDLAALGIPDMTAYVARYFERSGTAPVDMRFYMGFAQFRYAAMIQGILKRAQQGINASRRVLHTQARVVEIAALARRTLELDAR